MYAEKRAGREAARETYAASLASTSRKREGARSGGSSQAPSAAARARSGGGGGARASRPARTSAIVGATHEQVG